MRSDREYILDILDAIQQIEHYSVQGKDALKKEELLQVWFIHHIQIIGEAIRNISDDLRVNYPEIPWRQVVAMRNILVHNYLSVDIEEVWNTVERDIPELKHKIKVILKDLEKDA